MPLGPVWLVVSPLWLVGFLLGPLFLALNRRRRPSRMFTTPWVHKTTAAWVFNYTNRERKKHGRQPFKRYLILQSAAQGHSDWMAKHKYSHTGHKGSTPHQRIKTLGFIGGRTAENIHSVPVRRDRRRLARQMVADWMKSPGHRRNILDPQLVYIGIGIAQKGDWVYGTQNFGS